MKFGLGRTRCPSMGHNLLCAREAQRRLVEVLSLAEIEFENPVREEAPAVVSQLQARGLELVLLSGDRIDEVEAVEWLPRNSEGVWSSNPRREAQDNSVPKRREAPAYRVLSPWLATGSMILPPLVQQTCPL